MTKYKIFGVIAEREDGSKFVDGIYKSKRSAENFAKKCNECKYHHYKYSVKPFILKFNDL